MPSDRDTLLSFGFDPARIDWALKATNNAGLQPAMDHILANDGKSVPDMNSVTSAQPTAGDGDEDEDMKLAINMSQGGAEAEAKSIKCTECGKTFRNTAMAEFHAEKSGHDQFEESIEEIKPLTEEEKKQKLAELREKMTEKRAKKSAVDTEEQKANEALRRKAGKDSTQIRQEMQLKEAQKEAEQRKKDKLADAAARAKIKAQIEADKKARAEKVAAEKAAREGQTSAAGGAAVSGSAAPAASTAVAPTVKKEYLETRLQIRLSTGGPALTVTLPSDNTLQQVAEFVASRNLAFDADAVKFQTNFPKRVYNQDEYGKTLKELGLTPSAILMAS